MINGIRKVGLDSISAWVFRPTLRTAGRRARRSQPTAGRDSCPVRV